MGPSICLFLLYDLYVMTFRVLCIDYSSSRIISFSFIDIAYGFKCLDKNKQTNKKEVYSYFISASQNPTCAALDGSDSGGRCAWWGRWQQQQRSPSFSFLFPCTALVDCPHIAVASHPETSWHWQSVHCVHAVHGSLHSLRLQLTVDLFTNLLNLTIHLYLT